MLCGSGFAWIRKMEEHLNPDPGGKNRQKCTTMQLEKDKTNLFKFKIHFFKIITL